MNLLFYIFPDNCNSHDASNHCMSNTRFFFFGVTSFPVLFQSSSSLFFLCHCNPPHVRREKRYSILRVCLRVYVCCPARWFSSVFSLRLSVCLSSSVSVCSSRCPPPHTPPSASSFLSFFRPSLSSFIFYLLCVLIETPFNCCGTPGKKTKQNI